MTISLSNRLLSPAAVAACLLGAVAPTQAGEAPQAPAARLLDRALPGERPSRGHELFEAALASELFVSGSVGPFDVHVLVEDRLKRKRDAKAVLKDALEALQPAADLTERLWPEGGEGLISATRLPVVLADSQDEQTGFLELLSLLDHCERLGYSGWHPHNEVDTPTARLTEVVRTWQVQLFNLAHPIIDARRSDWLEHGIGYYSLAFVANRALRRGSWGMVPPWLANGLIDELDIAAHGQAWVGQESWSRQRPGWFRPGWSGFVPTGHRPPPPVTGPPANLAVTVQDTGDPWLSFKASPSRHWETLVQDRGSEAPASFVAAARQESYLPRDRAAARCLLHLMLSAGEGAAPALTTLLDREVKTPGSGMPDSEPLPVLFAQSLGGVAAIDRLEALTTRDLLVELGREDMITVIEGLDAAELLDLNDHREQAKWLWRRSQYSSQDRGTLFTALLEIEWVQQLAEWKIIAAQLDIGLDSALSASKRYPRKQRDMDRVVTAFWENVVRDPQEVAEEAAGKRKTSKRKRGRSGR